MTSVAPPKASSRVRQSLADMVRSLGLLAIVIAAVLLLAGRSLIFPGDDRRPAIDYSDEVSGFRTLSGVPALAPTALPTSWRANASTLTRPSPGGVQLHVGWAVPGSTYAGLDEATGPSARLIATVLGARGATVTGATSIGGRTWQTRVSYRGEQAFTLVTGKLTVVVTGNATDARLRLLAASLR